MYIKNNLHASTTSQIFMNITKTIAIIQQLLNHKYMSGSINQ
jgi:hypothetical protein